MQYQYLDNPQTILHILLPSSTSSSLPSALLILQLLFPSSHSYPLVVPSVSSTNSTFSPDYLIFLHSPPSSLLLVSPSLFSPVLYLFQRQQERSPKRRQVLWADAIANMTDRQLEELLEEGLQHQQRYLGAELETLLTSGSARLNRSISMICCSSFPHLAGRSQVSPCKLRALMWRSAHGEGAAEEMGLFGRLVPSSVSWGMEAEERKQQQQQQGQSAGRMEKGEEESGGRRTGSERTVAGQWPKTRRRERRNCCPTSSLRCFQKIEPKSLQTG